MKNNILTHYLNLRKEIDDLKHRIHTLELLSIRMRGTNIMRDLTTQYHELYEKAVKEQIVIEQIIDELEPLERRLIRYKYFDRLTWEGVALKLNYSKAQVQRIHTNILQKINNIL